jgi:hypothetical protein
MNKIQVFTSYCCSVNSFVAANIDTNSWHSLSHVWLISWFTLTTIPPQPIRLLLDGLQMVTEYQTTIISVRLVNLVSENSTFRVWASSAQTVSFLKMSNIPFYVQK